MTQKQFGKLYNSLNMKECKSCEWKEFCTYGVEPNWDGLCDEIADGLLFLLNWKKGFIEE